MATSKKSVKPKAGKNTSGTRKKDKPKAATAKPTAENTAGIKKDKVPPKQASRKRPSKTIVAVAKPKEELYANLSIDNPRHAKVFRFVDEYCIDNNGTQAAIRAGYAANSADVKASELLANTKVAKLVAEKKAEIAARCAVDQDYTLKHWKALVDVDTNELVEHRRCCCRHCWGTGFAYQETLPEFNDRQRLFIIENTRAEEQSKEPPVWDDSIELGFVGNIDPNPDCPACWGEGIGRVFFKDTRKMSPQAKIAYAGAKHGKDGLEVKIHSRLDAMEALSKHVGFYEKDKEVRTAVSLDIETLDRIFGEKLAAARARQREVSVRRGYIIDGESVHGD